MFAFMSNSMNTSYSTVIQIDGLSKRYANGFQALDNVSLNIKRGEIFALLGPNGAGKTTLISIICGLVNASHGSVTVDGFDYKRHYRQARSRIGLVPQEIGAESFENVLNSVSFSRGLFGKAPNPELIEKILKSLSLWDKRTSPQIALSGGMKRRVLIAKALSHEPAILFLDEPTAGVDVSLRQDMWALVRQLRDQGVTIILTTHYIEEAEDLADRVGIIQGGKLLLVEDKQQLMQKFGEKTMRLQLQNPITALPDDLADLGLVLTDDGMALLYHYKTDDAQLSIANILKAIELHHIAVQDIDTHRSSLEEIFVSLMEKPA